MNRNFKSIESRKSVLFILASFLCITSSANAQSSTGFVAKMLFPPRNYELPLGDTLIPMVRIWNTDTVADSGVRIQYRITNGLTGITIYSNNIVLPTIAPGDSLDTTFVPYISNSNVISELGTFIGCLYAGDTSCGLLFGIRRTSLPFFDPSDNYGKVQQKELASTSFDIPDQTMWVSVGATVVDGEDSTWDPPPPRYPGQGDGPDGMISPVIRLDRKDYNGNFYSGTGVGDTLTSFPINCAGRQNNVYVAFDFMRAGRHHYPLGWDDRVMFGPESTITDSAGNVIRAGDSLILEFEKPSGPVANPGPNDWNEMAAIDGGRDFEYQSLFASFADSGWIIRLNGIPTFVKDTTNYSTANFRFRLRLKANNNAHDSSVTIDDADQWYIDNLLVEPPYLPQVEVSWVRVVNPYSKVPSSQAMFPIFVSSHNVGVQGGFPYFPLQVDITNPEGDTVYSQYIETPTWYGTDTLIQFPDWDASAEPGNDTGAYTVFAEIPVNFNPIGGMRQTYTIFYLKTEPRDSGFQEFALDDAGMNPAPGVGNDIPKLTGIPGSGIGFSGGLAVGFQLAQYDSVAGARVYFGSANRSPDPINIELLSGELNGGLGVMATIYARRDTAHLDQFTTYYFPHPITLSGGATYWIAVNQLYNSMELGGTFARGGASIGGENNTFYPFGPIYSSPYGTQWGSGAADNNGNVSSLFAFESAETSGFWEPLIPSYGVWPAMTSVDQLLPEVHIGDTLPWVGAGTYTPMIRPILGPVPSQSGVKSAPATSSFTLEQYYPNPFDPTSTSTTITFTLYAQSQTSLAICNVLGTVVRTLLNANLTAGPHVISWDGRDEQGNFVPAGTYLAILFSDEKRSTSKLIVTH